MNCNECGEPMTELDPREITDPQPSRFIPRWRCDEKECPAQGEVVEDVKWQVGDSVEWTHGRWVGKTIELTLHHGVIDKINGPMAMVRIDGKPRRKRMQLRHLRRRQVRPRPAPDATAVSEGRGKR